MPPLADRSDKRIVFVHAHPDDEALSTGGTMARYAAEGAHVCLITCTNGEEGEIADGLGDITDLGAVRRAELEEACRKLGDIDLRMLGYHDSGMDGTPANDAPHAFIRQDITTVVDDIAAVFEELRPQIVVTYNEYGGYGHPDHIRTHEAAMAAAERCGVPKVYYTVFPRSLMRAGREVFGEDFFSEEEVERIGTPDEDITSVIDIAAYVTQKFDALEAHRTQLGTTKMFLDIPEDLRGPALGTEYYQLVGGDGAQETDLFA